MMKIYGFTPSAVRLAYMCVSFTKWPNARAGAVI